MPLANLELKSSDKKTLGLEKNIQIQEFNLITGGRETQDNEQAEKNTKNDRTEISSIAPKPSSIQEVELSDIHSQTEDKVTPPIIEGKMVIQEYDLTK